MNRADHVAANPDFPWLDAEDVSGVTKFLEQRGWLEPGERVLDCGRAGDGNMNLTLRVRTNCRSVVVKQARPWVEKYDHIEAPWNRVDFERRFYERVASIPDVASRMPRLLASDADARVLMLEYVDGADDFTALYGGATIDKPIVAELVKYVSALHLATRDERAEQFSNTAMRKLNHTHIFEIPLLEENGVPLEQIENGLSRAASELRRDDAYLGKTYALGKQYLETGTCLVHGDFFPGSWLWCPRGLFVIDPEFCFFGSPEVDLGCAIAHMALARQDRAPVNAILEGYDQASGGSGVEAGLVARYAAVEVMRRLIGVAQLPIPASDGWRAELLLRSRSAMLDSSWELLWT